MPGFAFHLETLDQAATRLDGSDPATAQLLKSPFAALGAFGPDLLLYTPPGETLAGALSDGTFADLVTKARQHPLQLTDDERAELVELYTRPFGAAYSTLFSQLIVTSWPSLNVVISFLAQANMIANDEDDGALGDFFAQVPAVKDALTTLGTTLPGGIKTLITLISTIVGLGPWMEENLGLLSAGLPRADRRGCRSYEYLRWHRSGAFARALMDRAQSDNQRAFALGWESHVAASVTAEPFVNNIAGGPYRLHWWRNRLVQNFVDAWTFGFAQTPATMAGDEPAPAYVDWTSVCAAGLQNRFNVGGLAGPASSGDLPPAVTAVATGDLGTLPQTFPQEITELLDEALDDVYPAAERPRPVNSLSGAAFADAYVGAFAVFWFLTDSGGPLGNNLLGSPPDGCGTTPPSWLSSTSAPAPQSSSGVTNGDAVCSVLLAIAAVLAFLCGGAIAGIVLLVVALEELPSIDWDKVRCILFWIDSVFLKLENALRDGLVLTGLAYPPPILLGGPGPDGSTEPATDFTGLGSAPSGGLGGDAPPLTGVALTRTNRRADDDKGYPRGLDRKLLLADLHFAFYPDSDVETDPTRNLIAPDRYPDLVLNGLGLNGAGVTSPQSTFPSGYELFGDAVSNAVELITRGMADLADFNLDGDRGYGWLGWHPQDGSNPTAPPVKVKQD